MDESRPTGWGGLPVEGPNVDAVRDAAHALRKVAVRTPLLPLRAQQDEEIWLKPEVLQPIGSFKLRGVYNWARRLSPERRALGLSTTSSGNTAQALGYVARHFGVPSRTLLPESVPENKLEAIIGYGVVPVKVSPDELFGYMLEEKWREEPFCYLNPWGDPDMIAGSGTLALEIAEDLSDVASIFLSVGGGGMAAGVGSTIRAIAPNTRIIAVQPESCAPLRAGFSSGQATWVAPGPSICDGTRVPIVVDEMLPLLREVVDDVLVVTEEAVRESVRWLALENKLVVEGSGALSLAGALSLDRSERGKSVCILSGGSIPPKLLAEILGDGSAN